MYRALLLSISLISSIGFGQEPVIEWQKSYGGSLLDGASMISRTSNGEYIVVGESESNDGDISNSQGSFDYWILKIDGTGNIIWQKSLGGSGFDGVSSLDITSDNGYIIAGTSDSNDGDVTNNNGSYDFWVVKLDDNSNIIWQKSLGGSNNEFARAIQQTSDGGYIVAGSSYSNDGDLSTNNGNSDFWIVKLTSSGSIEWEKSLGGTFNEEAWSIRETSDNNFIVLGMSNSDNGDVTENNGSLDLWIVKLSPVGDLLWQKSLGGSHNETARSIRETPDSGFIIVGGSRSNDGDLSSNNGFDDYWIVKTDSLGNIIWQKSFGGSLGDVAQSVQLTSNGEYVICGQSFSDDGDVLGNHGSSDSWVLKLNSVGDLIWQKSLGGSDQDAGSHIEQTSDQGFIVTGFSQSTDGDLTSNNGLSDYWVVKLSPETNFLSEDKKLKLKLYPNPTTNKLTITADKVVNASIKIVNVQGEQVMSAKMSSKEQSIDISSLSKGVYTIRFDDRRLPALSVIKE